jgi:predicted Zn-dependent peptidase
MRVVLMSVVVLIAVLAPLTAFPQTLEEKVQEFTLENGMKFLVIERHEAPVFFGAFAFKVGSVDERPGIYGVSHLLEHMLFKGTETVGTKDYKAERAFIEREDALAEEAKRTALKIESWRLEYLDKLATAIVASFSEEDRAAVGTDKALELELLIEQMTAEGPPAELVAIPGLLTDAGTDYFALYLSLKKAQMDLYDVTAEHRDLIVKDEFSEIYSANGERMLNAGTSNDATFYLVSLPSNRLELWMLMESDRLANPVFREFYSERDVVMEEKRMGENSPEDVMYDTFMSTAFSASAYGNPIVGWMSDLSNITRGDLENYYRQHYGPNNAIALLAGDVRFEEVKKLAQKYFGPLERGPASVPVVTADPPQKGERRVVLKEDAKPSLGIGYHIPKAPHPDSYALDMLASILSRGRTSRLYKEIHEAQALTRETPEVWSGPGSRLDPLFSIWADPRDPHTLEEVESAIYAVIDRIKSEPPEMKELERVWNQREAELVRSLGSNIGLAFSIGEAEAVRGDWRTVLTDLERLKAVTPEDVSRVAAKYLTEENRTVVWLVEEASEEGAAEGEPDIAELMEWVRTLPSEDQQALMMQFQSLDEKGRETLIQALFERMKAAKGTN